MRSRNFENVCRFKADFLKCARTFGFTVAHFVELTVTHRFLRAGFSGSVSGAPEFRSHSVKRCAAHGTICHNQKGNFAIYKLPDLFERELNDQQKFKMSLLMIPAMKVNLNFASTMRLMKMNVS